MAFDFNRIRDELMNVGDRINDATTVVKSSIDTRVRETELNKMYAELGRSYYSRYRDTPELCPETDLFHQIYQAEQEIAEIKEITMNRAGSVICPMCGATQSKDSFFCSACGSALK